MSDDEDFQVAVGTLLSSDYEDYEVEDVLGSGTYGEVAQCRKIATNETVAVKIIKSMSGIEEAKEEEETLKRMKEFGSDNFNIVRWNDSFTFEGRFCLEFEKLDISLFDLLQTDHSPTLELMAIRPIIQQLAIALEFLKTLGIVHADLKPENIMLVDHLRQPLRLKVIDFGLACYDPHELTGATLQTLWYRSPEVLLGAPFNEAIDVWSLGCIAVEMLKGDALFPGFDEYDMLRHMVHSIEKPPDHLLNVGMYTRQYFRAKETRFGPTQWRFKSACEARNSTCNPNRITILSDLEKDYGTLTGEDADADECDWENFVDLLTKMVEVDSSERITPSKILQHPFITMSHLVGTFDNSNHVKTCEELMSICADPSCDDGKEVDQVLIDESSDRPTTSAYSFPDEFRPTNSAYSSPYELQPAITVSTVPDEGYPARLSIEEQPLFWGSFVCEENSPVIMRKSDGVDDSECGNRIPGSTPENKRRNEYLDDSDPCTSSDGISPAKQRRDECLALNPMETVGQTPPPKAPLQKRKRETDPCSTFDGISSLKKLRVEFLDADQRSLTCGETSPQNPPIQESKREDADAFLTLDGKTMWDDGLASDLTETGGLKCPQKSCQNKRNDDAKPCSTLNGNSPTKENSDEGLGVDQTSPHNSPLHERLRDGENMCSTFDGNSQATKSDECQDADQTSPTGGEASRQKSALNKRKMDDAQPCSTFDGIFPSKKMRVEYLDSDQTTPKGSALSKRRRDEPCPTLDGNSSAKKMRNECLPVVLTSQQKYPMQEGNREDPDVCPTLAFNSRAKTFLDECPVIDITETGGLTSPQMSAMLKSKRDGTEPCTSSDGIPPYTQRRDECQDAHRTSVTSEGTSPQKSALHTKRRDDAEPCSTFDDNSSAKERRDDCLVAVLTSPHKSHLQERLRVDATICSNSDGISHSKNLRIESIDAERDNTDPWETLDGKTSPAMKRSKDSPCGGQTKRGGETIKGKFPLHTKNRVDAEQCSTSADTTTAKKRKNVNLSKELTDSIKQLLMNTEAWSGRTNVKRRKRASMEMSGSKEENKTPTKRTRRGSLDSGEV